MTGGGVAAAVLQTSTIAATVKNVRGINYVQSGHLDQDVWNLRCELPGVVQEQVTVLSAEDNNMTQGDIVGDPCPFAHSG